MHKEKHTEVKRRILTLIMPTDYSMYTTATATARHVPRPRPRRSVSFSSVSIRLGLDHSLKLFILIKLMS